MTGRFQAASSYVGLLEELERVMSPISESLVLDGFLQLPSSEGARLEMPLNLRYVRRVNVDVLPQVD